MSAKQSKRKFVASSKVFRISKLSSQPISIDVIKKAVVKQLGELIFFFNPTPDYVFFIPKDSSSNAVRPGMEIVINSKCKLRTDYSADLYGPMNGQDGKSLIVRYGAIGADTIAAMIKVLHEIAEPLEIIITDEEEGGGCLVKLNFATEEMASIFHMAWQVLISDESIGFADL